MADPDGPQEEGEDATFFDAPPMAEQERMVEALLFASAAPLSIREMEDRMPHGADAAQALIHVRKRYEGRGVSIRKVGQGWAIRTAPDLAFLMRREQVEQKRLSRAAVETLAIIAYHQPTTRAEIEEIRGVTVSKGTIDLLMDQDWIKLGRRRMTPGRPITFVTTPVFLDQFGLESPRDLPGVKELKAAGLLENRAAIDLDGGEEDAESDEQRRDDNQNEMFE